MCLSQFYKNGLRAQCLCVVCNFIIWIPHNVRLEQFEDYDNFYCMLGNFVVTIFHWTLIKITGSWGGGDLWGGSLGGSLGDLGGGGMLLFFACTYTHRVTSVYSLLCRALCSGWHEYIHIGWPQCIVCCAGPCVVVDWIYTHRVTSVYSLLCRALCSGWLNIYT